MLQIRVMIVEEHPQVRVGVGRVLEMYDDIEVVGEATSGEEALALCERNAPNVVLTGLKLPSMDGPATIHAIKQRFPTVQVLALTAYEEHDLLTRALQAGALGCLLKYVTSKELHEAILRVNAGQAVISPEVTNIINTLS